MLAESLASFLMNATAHASYSQIEQILVAVGGVNPPYRSRCARQCHIARRL
jgi:hypothetical protein